MSIPLTTIYCVFYPRASSTRTRRRKKEKGSSLFLFGRKNCPDGRHPSARAPLASYRLPSVTRVVRFTQSLYNAPPRLSRIKRQEKTKNRGLTRRPARPSGASHTKSKRGRQARTAQKASARTVKVRAPVTIYGGALTRPCVRDRRRRLSPRRRKPLYR